MASSLSTIVAKDGAGSTIVGGLLAVDKSGAGTGPFFAAQTLVDTQGVNTATIKAASTAVVAGDTAFAVGLHPTSPLPAGTNVIGHVIVDSGTITAVTAITNALPVGANVIGKTSIDQTTDLTTNKVRAFIHDGTTALPILAASTGAPSAATPAIPVSIRDVNANVQGGAPVTIGAVVPTATANGSTSARVKAAATTNATNLKASAGQIYSIDVFNNAAYNVYLKLYNKASAPTVGTDVPTWTIPIAAGGGFSRELPRGKTFSTGIAYAITKLEADSDTTVVVLDDLTGSIDWI